MVKYFCGAGAGGCLGGVCVRGLKFETLCHKEKCSVSRNLLPVHQSLRLGARTTVLLCASLKKKESFSLAFLRGIVQPGSLFGKAGVNEYSVAVVFCSRRERESERK